MTRYQPSPNEAISAKASPVALTVRGDSGFWASRTSASTRERITDWPGKGRPMASRTVLRTPSVPTT